MTLLAAIWQHANHVRRYLSYYFSPNTHLTGEALGLFYAGTLFPEFRDAAEWRQPRHPCAAGRKPRAGVSPMASTSSSPPATTRYTVETYLHFVLLAARNGVTLPRDLVEQVAQMVEFLVAVRRPDGSIPAIGDGDGGVLLPLVGASTRRQPGRVRGRGRALRSAGLSRGRPKGRRRKCSG